MKIKVLSSTAIATERKIINPREME